jgi:outer membrane lipoprotein-sorting protein
MEPKRKAIAAALVGTALGAAGLVAIALPASAGDVPTLPAISAEDLVQSTLAAKAPAFDGTVQVDDNLGLPSIATGGDSPLNFDSATVYNDGKGDNRLSLAKGNAQETFVHDGSTLWSYSSRDNTATRYTEPAGREAEPQGVTGDNGKLSDPATAATGILAKIRQSSTVTVEGTARVAGRPAYELVLTPKPTERTLLREVRVAIDSQTRLPLRLAVLGNGSSTPALQIAFSRIEFTAQPDSLFHFSPPQGAKVTEAAPDPQAGKDAAQALADTRLVGDGWDTVLVGKVPADLLSPRQPASEDGKSFDPRQLIDRFGKPVSGAWGSGHEFGISVGTAVLTDDGRFAIGAVPDQVLFAALAQR